MTIQRLTCPSCGAPLKISPDSSRALIGLILGYLQLGLAALAILGNLMYR